MNKSVLLASTSLVVALALADLTPVRAQATADTSPPAAPAETATTPAAPAETAAQPQPPVPEVDPLVAKVRELAAAGAKGKGASADRSAMAEFYAARTSLAVGDRGRLHAARQ